jgi:hypothetical protein
MVARVGRSTDHCIINYQPGNNRRFPNEETKKDGLFYSATAGKKVEDAMQAMGQGFDLEYQPDKNRYEYYNRRFKKYKALGRFTEQQSLQII